MGYRSDVAYTIRFKTEEAYRLFILEAKANGLGGCFSDDTSYYGEAECNDEKCQINFEARSTKWYDSYPDVQKHMALLAQAESWAESDTHNEIKDGGTGHDAYRIGWAFVRIGEDNDDTEERHGGDSDYNWLHVSRQIITDWS